MAEKSLIDIEKRSPVCMGCGHEIFDQWILRVAPDLEWHAACLKCVDCNEYLDQSSTCFVRDGRIYCKRDYTRLFASKCPTCNNSFKKEDYVMRAKNKIFHVNCFHCVACNRQLLPGEEFALRGHELFCKDHHNHPDILDKESLDRSTSNNNMLNLSHDTSFGSHDSYPTYRSNNASPESCIAPLAPSAPIVTQLPPSGPCGPISGGSGGSSGSGCSERLGDLGSRLGSHINGDGSSNGSASDSRIVTTTSTSKKDRKKESKTTRVRTVLNEKQLHTLRTCYNANPRPDALMKEQLTEMTGLSPRVIRVWFQNKRCKDKKRQILMKQVAQQAEKNQALTDLRLQGIGPLMASSPTRHDVQSMLQHQIEVQQFQQNPSLWGPHEFTPLKPPDHLDSGCAPFQQLMHGFGDPSSDPTAPLSFLGVPQLTIDGRPGELTSISPSVAASDLSSPSCSE